MLCAARLTAAAIRWSVTHIAGIVGWAAIVGAPGCSALSPVTTDALDAAEAKWASAKISSYRMAVDIELFSLDGGYFEVTVKDGVSTHGGSGSTVDVGARQSRGLTAASGFPPLSKSR